MSPDDQELWKRVTDTLHSSYRPPATVIRPFSRRVVRTGYFRTSLDLHGYTLQEAHAQTRAYVREAQLHKLKHVVIITGLSGGIRREFPFWVESMAEIKRIETLNGGGAYRIHLFRLGR